MKASLLCAVACAACASAPLREPSCTAPANRVEIQHVQVGWQRQDPTIQSPVVDPRVPTRDPRQAEVIIETSEYIRCKAAALCLQPDECAVVRSNVAFHVLKRID